MDEWSRLEKEKYDRIWKSFPEYRRDSPSDFLFPAFFSHFEKEIKPSQTVIDFGCGPGRSALIALKHNLAIHLVDISENCLDPEIFLLHLKKKFSFTQSSLWDLPQNVAPAEWIICFDVLEHVPEEKVDACLKGMSLRMKQGGFFSIFLQQELFGETVGETLHLTLKPANWWREKIGLYFRVEKEFSTDEKTLVLTVRKK